MAEMRLNSEVLSGQQRAFNLGNVNICGLQLLEFPQLAWSSATFIHGEGFGHQNSLFEDHANVYVATAVQIKHFSAANKAYFGNSNLHGLEKIFPPFEGCFQHNITF